MEKFFYKFLTDELETIRTETTQFPVIIIDASDFDKKNFKDILHSHQAYQYIGNDIMF
ncbi:hypothetical protein [Desulfuribacillus stibiiarsenatis]|uniref:hypothetical protein n=1 Tax=Desulfuribacillus stibiiarsenatis TaxID=1390249 RepID=UPI00159F099E|nr:hypothetical protein [Desulfuribacillus stibiiarsenatis]